MGDVLSRQARENEDLARQMPLSVLQVVTTRGRGREKADPQPLGSRHHPQDPGGCGGRRTWSSATNTRLWNRDLEPVGSTKTTLWGLISCDSQDIHVNF